MGKVGFSPIIGLAMVVALALAAVFGSMSLANPATADEHLDVTTVVVRASDSDGPVTDSATATLDENTAYQYDVTFALATGETYTHNSGDTVVVDVKDFQLPSSIEDNDVRMWVADSAAITNESAVDDSIAVRLPASDVALSGSKVTITLPDFTDTSAIGGDFIITAADHFVHIRFVMGADIKTPDDLMASDIAADADNKEILWSVEGVDAAVDSGLFVEAEYESPPVIPPGSHSMIEVDASSMKPGAEATYTLTFVSGKNIRTGTGEIELKMEDFDVPPSIDENKVTMRITDGPSVSNTPCVVADGQTVDGVTEGGLVPLGSDGNCPTNSVAAAASAGDDYPLADKASNPEAVTVDGEDVTLTVPDFGDAGDGDQGILKGDEVTVIFRQSAGITNPTEGGKTSPGKEYPWEVDGQESTDSVTVPIIISLDENAGVRGDTIVVTGKGFKNGHTATFWLDRNMNNMRDTATEAVLCSAEVQDDDTAKCSFDVSNPPFTGGVGGTMQMTYEDDGDLKCNRNSDVLDCNFVNGADGLGDIPVTITGAGANVTARDEGKVNDQTFELEAAISISPSGGSVGDSVQIQMTDFPMNASVNSVTIAGVMVPGVSASADTRGNRSFSITIPNNAPQGVERLEVNAGDPEVKANTKITIAGPSIQVTPATVIANQRVSLVGTGFTRSSYICCSDPDGASGDEHQKPVVTFGGEVIPVDRINDGKAVLVDNGGNWSASVNLPLSSATTASGTKELQITDSKGRTGSQEIMIASREVTVTPSISRVGTVIVVRGKNFPSRNDGGDPFNVELTYKATSGSETRVSASPDAGGSFEIQMTVPTGASIPSTNTIQVEFEESDGEKVTTNVPHTVPEGSISISKNRGPSGTTISVTGEGFKNFVPISRVTVGDLEVTPSPRPSTNAQGMVDFNIIIPGLEVGIQTIEVDVGDTTASVGFTVSLSSEVGESKPVVEAVEPLGDNLVVVFHFNNDTKEWTFYSSDPAAVDANTLTHMTTGQTYLIQIKADQEVILNTKTRSLTCVGGNCWNVQVW